MIKKGNMTDAEYIVMLENEIKKRDKKIDKLEVENECLKRDCHIYLEALILSKHRIFGKSSEHKEVEGHSHFSTKQKMNMQKNPKNLFQKQLKAIQEEIRKQSVMR